MASREKNILLVIVIIAVIAGGIWFGYFRKTERGPSRISGQVVTVDGDAITIEGIVEGQLPNRQISREVKTVTLRITPKTQFLKTVYLMNTSDRKPGENFTPETIQELGVSSDIRPNTRIIEANVRENLLEKDSATAVKIHYATFSF